jgi:divinyl protochlorophyllide a 8-vinyl-reductase
MLDHARAAPETGALIGPNAILQLQEPVAAHLGPDVMGQVLDMCGVAMPSGDRMIPQEDVAQVHHALQRWFPSQMGQVSDLAGQATGRYIRAHRIPPLARRVLRLLPNFISERLLTKAILAHAWTFCGSGSVTATRIAGVTEFALANNPLVDPAQNSGPQCRWHAAVFGDLYAQLLGTQYEVHEAECCGSGAGACRFVIRRRVR